MKCDSCGEKAVSQTGMFVYCHGCRHGKMCKTDHTLQPGSNPIFKNERAWLWWSKKHPRLAKKVLAHSGPKFQFFLIKEAK